MQKYTTHMILLGDNPTNPDKPILGSGTKLLKIRDGDILKIKNRLYQVLRQRTKPKTQGDIQLTMQFIYVKPITKQQVLQQIQKAIAK